jgi:hypothetical protein
MCGMALRLLAIDLPPLVRDLVAKALLRRDAEAVFLDLPATGGDVEALAIAARADAVVALLDKHGWPPYCARMVNESSGMPLFGLDCDTSGGRISELRSVETRRTDIAVDGLTIDDFVAAAGRAATGGSA